jgi:hypothetical protein
MPQRCTKLGYSTRCAALLRCWSSAAAARRPAHCNTPFPPHTSTPHPQASRRDRDEQEKLLAEFELRRKIRATLVPTDDGKVREMLRQLQEPITLFGEREVRWDPCSACGRAGGRMRWVV